VPPVWPDRAWTSPDRCLDRGPPDAPDPVAPPAPDWSDLVALRWGPGLEDDTPGIVLEEPDRDRLRAALQAAAAEADRYAGLERRAIRAEPRTGDRLRGPRRTGWNALVWSDFDAPGIELFGPGPAASRACGRVGRDEGRPDEGTECTPWPRGPSPSGGRTMPEIDHDPHAAPPGAPSADSAAAATERAAPHKKKRPPMLVVKRWRPLKGQLRLFPEADPPRGRES
jgi:hypothetical protein